MGFLDQLDEEYAPSWKPEQGDIGDGIIVRVSRRDGTWGPYAIITVRRIVNEELTNEEIALHMQGSVLQKFVDLEEPAIGDRIAVRYDGMKANPKGVQYRDYSKTLGKAATLDAKFRLDSFNPPPATAPAAPAASSSTPPAAPPAAPPAPAATSSDDEPW